MKKKRHNYTPEEKVLILKRHLTEGVAVSALCDEYNLQPKVFYDWQKQLFENAASAFIRGGTHGSSRKDQKRIQQLEQKLQKKNEVVSELMEEHVKLKKELGDL